jgi:hypothetical protein
VGGLPVTSTRNVTKLRESSTRSAPHAHAISLRELQPYQGPDKTPPNRRVPDSTAEVVRGLTALGKGYLVLSLEPGRPMKE